MSTFHNRTRRTASIPRRLVREGKIHLLPVYYLGLTTELGKEAIHNSGSYDFADHIYGNRPAGRFLIGYLLDAVFLNLKSARALRSRYRYARSEIQRLIAERADAVDVLAVPC
ncbi:MAG: class I SAM-dependent methyltransferase family protein, partial [Candidatus Dormibacteraeota bacterium]|nr:class I SAM-dependent methyltransferase family protein [Candidatus Dormibacteraeota bacterium]